MLSILNTLLKVKTALTGIDGLTVWHYTCPTKSDRFCVWAESGESSEILNGDNQKVEQSLEGTIDFFTKTEYDTFLDSIQTALNNAHISFELESVQYEDETQYIHYEWRFCT